jgi:ABC-type glycerol-3-phosphate transport system substrate-binding protein
MAAADLPSTREDFMAERSWDNIQAWAEKIREQNKDQGFWGITTWEVYHQSLGAIFQSIASDLYYEDEGLIRFDSEEMQKALEIQARWSWTDVAPVPAWGQPGEITDIFPAGRCGLWQGQVGIVARGQRVLGNEIIPYAMPVLVEEGGTGGNQWYTTTGFVLNKSANAQAVTDFYLTLFGPQNDEQAELTLAYNWFPIFRSHWEKYVDGDSNFAWVRDFLPQLENAQLVPRNPYYEIEQTVAKKYCELAQAQQISIPDACQAMMDEVRAGVERLDIEWESL